MQKNLRISKKSSTFAPAFEKRALCKSLGDVNQQSVCGPKSALLNGVMVALQILVLSVWVRVLVEQQKRAITIWWLFFFCLNLWTRTHHLGSPQILICGESAAHPSNYP